MTFVFPFSSTNENKKLKIQISKNKTPPHQPPPGEEEHPAARVPREPGKDVQHLELVDEARSLISKKRCFSRFGSVEYFLTFLLLLLRLKNCAPKQILLTTKHAETATILLTRDTLGVLLPATFTSLPSATTSKTKKRKLCPATRFHLRAQSSP